MNTWNAERASRMEHGNGGARPSSVPEKPWGIRTAASRSTFRIERPTIQLYSRKFPRGISTIRSRYTLDGNAEPATARVNFACAVVLQWIPIDVEPFPTGGRSMPTGSVVFLIFTGVVTFAVVLQTAILLAIFVAARQAERRVMEQVNKLREDVAPTLKAAKDVLVLLDEIGPKIRTITTNVQTVSERAVGQANHIEAVINQITGRTQTVVTQITDRTLQQVIRIDGMVTETISGISRGTRAIQDNLLAPVRQLGGWLNTAVSAFDIFGRGTRRTRPR